MPPNGWAAHLGGRVAVAIGGGLAFDNRGPRICAIFLGPMGPIRPMTGKTMRAMRLHTLGEALIADDIPLPEPGPGDVRIDVAACGLNFADTLMVAGRYQEKPPLPLTPGLEVSGRVAALGPGVSGPAPGTRVAAWVPSGGFAEAVVAPAASTVTLPDSMDDVTAAGFLIAYGTSHLALVAKAALQQGETLLVLGAAGGVGLTAVEIGRTLGATVIAAARGEAKLAIARAAGAHHGLDTETADLTTEVKALGGADVIYDAVGGAAFDAAFRAAKPEARILPIGFASGGVPQIPANILLVKNMTVFGLYWGGLAKRRPDLVAGSLAELFAWQSAGRLSPHISHTLPLAEANAALDLLRERKATGKVVLTVP